MKTSDLSQLFRSDRFPSRFIQEYVDLLSKFEVALPMITGLLLVPSLLPEQQIGSRNIVAPGTSAVVARAMNMAAYTDNRVLRRQYLMSYVPSGFWARLMTRYGRKGYIDSNSVDIIAVRAGEGVHSLREST